MADRYQFIFFLLLISINSSKVDAADSISSNSSISGTQKKLISNDGYFELGFFEPGNSSKYYLGIWYNPSKITIFTSVWVANRETPISDSNSSEFKISEDGNLVLLNESKSVIWSSNVTPMQSRNTVAVLSDSGNLILRDVSNSSNVLWQSFDHPGNTWLPGGKLAFNKITNRSMILTSWKNRDDPSPGTYSLETDTTGQYILKWNLTNNYWESGIWTGQSFTGVPEIAFGRMALNGAFNFDYVNNNKERYFNYSLKNKMIAARLLIDATGHVEASVWIPGTGWSVFWRNPKGQCDVYGVCGAFSRCNSVALPNCDCMKGFSQASPKDWALGGWTSGCARNTALNCIGGSSGDGDRFYEMDDVKLPANPYNFAVRSLADCEAACYRSCSCSAFSYTNGCSLWNSDLVNLQQLYDGTGSTLYLRLAASELPSTKRKKGLIIGVVVGITASFTFACLLILRMFHKQRRQLLSSLRGEGSTLVMYKYVDLQHATMNFRDKLGGGGFGLVFKGVLPDSTTIAVKKLEGLHQGEKQFRTEISTIGLIQHVNLVRLRGFCSEGDKRLLVYEYMPNGSLDSHLFQDNSESLGWAKRYLIATGTARALSYLHEQCRDCIVHCDIKPENVLLDEEFCPKVADFGMAKLMGREISKVLTTMRGTIGYLAPEWISGLPITPKVDVYSYGMMLFEIISGRRNSIQDIHGNSSFFPILAATKIDQGDYESLLDERLAGSVCLEELERACKVACWCIQDDEAQRPAMGQVVLMLEGKMEVKEPPMPTYLQNLVNVC